jgi:glyoxylase-like metal-dependent hydrolase (beta-lactamase superfamily II)
LSGDTLFADGWGRTDLPGGSDEQMVGSIARLARVLPPGVRVLPGHGRETTVARELAWMQRVAATGRLILPGR